MRGSHGGEVKIEGELTYCDNCFSEVKVSELVLDCDSCPPRFKCVSCLGEPNRWDGEDEETD
jgi:hypothetical protein